MDWDKIRNSDDLEWWEKDDIDSILEEYPEIKNMSRHELIEFKSKLYWESQHLIEEANRIESYSDTIYRVLDITV